VHDPPPYSVTALPWKSRLDSLRLVPPLLFSPAAAGCRIRSSTFNRMKFSFFCDSPKSPPPFSLFSNHKLLDSSWDSPTRLPPFSLFVFATFTSPHGAHLFSPPVFRFTAAECFLRFRVLPPLIARFWWFFMPIFPFVDRFIPLVPSLAIIIFFPP